MIFFTLIENASRDHFFHADSTESTDFFKYKVLNVYFILIHSNFVWSFSLESI